MSIAYRVTWGRWIADIGLALLIWANMQYVTSTIQESLRLYVPKVDFETYRKEHADFSAGKLKEISERFDKVETNQERNAERLQNMAVDIRQLLTEIRLMDRKLDRLERVGADARERTTNFVGTVR